LEGRKTKLITRFFVNTEFKVAYKTTWEIILQYISIWKHRRNCESTLWHG